MHGRITAGLPVIRELRPDQLIMYVSGHGRLTPKYQIGFRGVGQNLEQACKISLTVARLDRSLHEVNVGIRNSVVRTSILAPAYKLLGDHRIR